MLQLHYKNRLQIKTRMPFSRRPTSYLPIESQTPMIWPWYDLDLIYDLDLRQVKPSKTDVQVAKFSFSMRWPWPWPNDLDTQNWSRYGQDVLPYQESSFCVKSFKSIAWTDRHTDRHTHRQTHTQIDTHTDTTKTLPLPHTREVIKDNTVHPAHLECSKCG